MDGTFLTLLLSNENFSLQMLFHQFALEVLAEAGRDGFQPCLMDTGAPVPMPNWERHMTLEAFRSCILDVFTN